MPTVRVAYRTSGSDAPHVFDVSGGLDESFSARMRAAIPLATTQTFTLATPTSNAILVRVIPEEVTMGDIAPFAAGETLPIDQLGRGGSAFLTLWDLLSTATTFAAALEVATNSVDLRRFREHRKEARAWVADGVEKLPAMRLKQLIRAQASWRHEHFVRVFGIDRYETSILLRGLGYTYYKSSDTWVEQPDS